MQSTVCGGSGWTGQPAVFDRDGRTWVVFGAYDRQIHFVDYETGEDITSVTLSMAFAVPTMMISAASPERPNQIQPPTISSSAAAVMRPRSRA